VAASAAPVPASEGEWRAVRRAVLALVRGRDACGKLVLTGAGDVDAFRPLLDDVAALAPALPLFVQPVTPVNGVPAPDRARIDALVELALERGLSVRVVPQVHRLLGVP